MAYVPVEFPQKRGAKTKYRPEMCDIVINVMREGGHIAKICSMLCIDEKTFHNWKDRYKEFESACNYGKTLSKAFYEELLLKAATGQIPNFNFNSVAMIMNNKFRDEYTRSHNGSGTNIEITNNTVNMDSRSIDDQITQKLEYLKALGISLGSEIPVLDYIEVENAEDDEDREDTD